MNFGSFKQMMEDAAASGQKLFARVTDKATFERIVILGYLVGHADNDFDENEKTGIVKTINEKLPQFDMSDILRVIEECDNKMSFSATMGKMELMKEVGKAKGDAAELIIQIASFIGESDGTFDDDEKAVVRLAAERMGLNPQHYGL